MKQNKLISKAVSNTDGAPRVKYGVWKLLALIYSDLTTSQYNKYRPDILRSQTSYLRCHFCAHDFTF